MTDLHKAAQQALEALDSDNPDIQLRAATALRAALAEPVEPRNQCGETCERAKLCATCAQALAQQDEPTAWRCACGANLFIDAQGRPASKAEPVEPVATVVARQYDDGTYAGNALDWAGRNCEDDFPVGTKLYTAPPQRKPLTEEEVEQCFRDAGITIKGHRWTNAVRNVERAHGIGEQP